MTETTRQHEMPKDNNGESVQCLGFLGVNHNLISGATAVHTPVFNSKDGAVVRVFSAANIYISIGIDAIATTNHAIFPASGVEYFKVREGERVSILQVDTGGVATITHMA